MNKLIVDYKNIYFIDEKKKNSKSIIEFIP